MNDTKYPELYLVDGSGFIFRAFHALPPLTRKDGTPIGAVLGFVNMLQKLLTDFEAHQLAIIFDAARKNFRNDIYADYKANRSETPPELIPQFPLIRAATEAFNLPSLELEGYEADDLIATYVRQACERGQHVTIVSSDKDLMQLIGPCVSMWDPIKSKRLGIEDVIEKFGVPPEKVVDIQALAGDASDNVPGVPGIGVKTAAQLITEYGDLETLLARAGEIKQNKRRELLIEHAEQARISKRLVMLDNQSPVPVALDALEVRPFSRDKLLSFLTEQGFKTAINRLHLQDGASVQDGVPFDPPQQVGAKIEQNYQSIQSAQQLKEFLGEAVYRGQIAIHVISRHGALQNVPSQNELIGVGLALASGKACYVPLGHGNAEDMLSQAGFAQIKMAEAMALLKPVLEDRSILKIGHNIKDDMQVLAQHGIQLSPFDDTMMLAYVLDGTLHNTQFERLVEAHFGHQTISYGGLIGSGKKQIGFDQVGLESATNYMAEYADYILRLHQLLKPRLAQEKMTALYETIERPLIGVIAQMETNGVRVDPNRLRQLDQEFSQRAAELEQEIHKIAGQVFNVGSPKQLGEILFDVMKLPGGERGSSGAYTTNVSVLEELSAQGHVIADLVLEWRQLTKLKTTYCDGLLAAIHPKTGRVHTSYMLAAVNTGRLSSTDPNIQNLPVRTEIGRTIRSAFVADPGKVLLSADYSQVELRLAAAMAQIPALAEAFRKGEDVHERTAAEVFGVPLSDVTSEMRRSAKMINFGIIYGISAFGLAQRLKIPHGEAAQYIKRYMARFPELKTYMERTKEEAREHGFVRTLYGRKCVIDGAKDRNPMRRAGAERQAINAPLQGTAADIIKRAMVRIMRVFKAQGIDAKMLMQVHDELVFEVKVEDAERIAVIVKETMERSAPELNIPLAVDADWGEVWT